jgi:peptidoglycan/xylan/chitin deacetylase (PgdA/CDA1 family)
MPARISTWIARRGRPAHDAWRAQLPRSSARALLATAVGLLALSVAVALPGRDHVLEVPDAGAQQPPAQAKPVLYRVIGCRSTGTAAHREGPARREVAFGFDDGPWSDTPAFVSMLERARARATFFMIGRQIVGADRSLLLRELRDGDVLGDHTYDHPDLVSSPDVRSELLRTIARIRALSGYTPCVFRPPYGDTDAAVQQTARSVGLSTVLWNVDPADYTQPGARAIEQRVLAQVRPGSIVISHDGGGPRGQTLAAYPGIIAKLRARGYRIATLLEMLGYRPVYVPCIELCDGVGRPRKALPKNAIVERAP